jgi:hypothetical protein
LAFFAPSRRIYFQLETESDRSAAAGAGPGVDLAVGGPDGVAKPVNRRFTLSTKAQVEIEAAASRRWPINRPAGLFIGPAQSRSSSELHRPPRRFWVFLSAVRVSAAEPCGHWQLFFNSRYGYR